MRLIIIFIPIVIIIVLAHCNRHNRKGSQSRFKWIEEGKKLKNKFKGRFYKPPVLGMFNEYQHPINLRRNPFNGKSNRKGMVRKFNERRGIRNYTLGFLPQHIVSRLIDRGADDGIPQRFVANFPGTEAPGMNKEIVTKLLKNFNTRGNFNVDTLQRPNVKLSKYPWRNGNTMTYGRATIPTINLPVRRSSKDENEKKNPILKYDYSNMDPFFLSYSSSRDIPSGRKLNVNIRKLNRRRKFQKFNKPKKFKKPKRLKQNPHIKLEIVKNNCSEKRTMYWTNMFMTSFNMLTEQIRDSMEGNEDDKRMQSIYKDGKIIYDAVQEMVTSCKPFKKSMRKIRDIMKSFHSVAGRMGGWENKKTPIGGANFDVPSPTVESGLVPEAKASFYNVQLMDEIKCYSFTQFQPYEQKTKCDIEPYSKPELDPSQNCEKSSSSNNLAAIQVIGGTLADYTDNPCIYSFVHIRITRGKSTNLCGGSLIVHDHGRSVIVTAAHCVENSDRVLVMWGYSEMNIFSSSTLRLVEVDQVVIHEHWNSELWADRFSNDVALLMTTQFYPDQYHKPICLPRNDIKNELNSITNITIVGNGYTTNSGSLSPQVKMSTTTKLDDQECMSRWGNGYFNASIKMCCHDVINFSNTCLGDSGGPYIAIHNDVCYIMGITSFGYVGGCVDLFYPTVQTEVMSYLAWIDMKLANWNMTIPKECGLMDDDHFATSNSFSFL